jgi:hypothetical protein
LQEQVKSKNVNQTVLAGNFWREIFGGNFLAGNFWREIFGGKIYDVTYLSFH